MPPLHNHLTILPNQIVSHHRIPNTKDVSSQMSRVVKELPSGNESCSVNGNQTFDCSGGGEVEKGKEEDLHSGFGDDCAEQANHGHYGSRGSQTVAEGAGGYFKHTGSEGADHGGGQVHGQKLFFAWKLSIYLKFSLNIIQSTTPL